MVFGYAAKGGGGVYALDGVRWDIRE